MAHDRSAVDNISIGFVAARGDGARVQGAAREAGIDGKLSALP
ncbi:hypothetical protein [Nonomuraea sp. NPDC050202]